MTYAKKFFLILIPLILSVSTSAHAEELNDTYISDEYQEYIYEISKSYNVCPELIMSLIEHESSGKAEAVNGNCIGLMQVSKSSHKKRMERLGVTDLTDAYSNILVGTDYLMELAEEYEDLYLVIAKYHGEKKPNPYEPSAYVLRICERSEELEVIHSKGD